MQRLSDKIIEEFGGTTELAKLVRAPVSTVNSWRRRVTDSRLNHLQLAAMAAGKVISWDTLEEADSDEAEAA